MKPEDNMVSGYPEVIVETIKPEHDFLIIACDGIWDCMTSQQAVDYVYETKTKILKRASTVVAGSGPMGKSPPPRKSVASPTKKYGKSGSASPAKSKTPIDPSKISKIIEMMMDKCCPSNLAASEGIGSDNMTGMIIEFNKPGQSGTSQ
jgi:serine/threonine protein phosphatase PrpC